MYVHPGKGAMLVASAGERRARTCTSTYSRTHVLDVAATHEAFATVTSGGLTSRLFPASEAHDLQAAHALLCAQSMLSGLHAHATPRTAPAVSPPMEPAQSVSGGTSPPSSRAGSVSGGTSPPKETAAGDRQRAPAPLRDP